MAKVLPKLFFQRDEFNDRWDRLERYCEPKNDIPELTMADLSTYLTSATDLAALARQSIQDVQAKMTVKTVESSSENATKAKEAFGEWGKKAKTAAKELQDRTKEVRLFVDGVEEGEQLAEGKKKEYQEKLTELKAPISEADLAQLDGTNLKDLERRLENFESAVADALDDVAGDSFLARQSDLVDEANEKIADMCAAVRKTEPVLDNLANRVNANEDTLVDFEGRILWLEGKVEKVEGLDDRVAFLEERRRITDFHRGRVDHSRGTHLFWDGKWDLAIERFQAATRLSPQWADPYYFLAFAHGCKGEKVLASKELEFALALDRRNPIKYWNQLMSRLQGGARQQIERLRFRALAGMPFQISPDMWDAWKDGTALGIPPLLAVLPEASTFSPGRTPLGPPTCRLFAFR